MNEKPTVHVIDDEAAMRGSLEILLKTAGYKVRVYPLAQDFLDGVASAEKGCVVTDVRMPDMTGIQMMVRLRELKSRFPVVVITAFADIPLAVEAMKLGAVDFIEKPFDDQTLFAAVRAAIALDAKTIGEHPNAQEFSARIATLSPREKDILKALVEGSLNKTTAYDLGISVRTVESHRAHLMEKMQADSLAQLIQMAMLASTATGSARDGSIE